jgi:hypothetical protein
MANGSDEIREGPLVAVEPSEVIGRAADLVRRFPECFWFWHPQARVRDLGDARLVIENLRKYGGWRAWRAAQELHRCLLLVCRNES